MTTTSFNVSWGAVPNATSYRLDVSTDLFRTFVSGYENLTVNGTTQSITGLTPGITYYVRVRAVNNKVIGPNSSILIQSTVTVAPNQPTISNVTVETFTVSWNNVIGASSYRIDVATTSNFTSGFVTGYNNQTVTGTSINVVDLSPGTTYYVRVRAVNDQTVNPVTSTNSVSAVQSTQVLISSAPTARSITANWTNPGNAVSYRLDVSTVSNFATRLTGYDNLTVNTRSQSITGLTPGTTYYVRVRSVNSVGVVSANSSSLIQVTVPRAPVQLNIESISSSTISLSWSPVNGASSYRIDVATNNQFSNPIYVNREENNINHTISSLSSATTYYIRVRAINNQTANTVISANSTAISVLTLPNSINQLSVSAINTTGFTVNWVRVAGAINYQLDVSTVSNFSSFVTGYQNLIVNDIRQVITGLNPGETYYVRVRSVNSSGSTTNSPVLTQQTKLIVPSNLNVTGISTTNFTISWGSVLNATGYFIDVSEEPDFATRLINYDNLLVNNTSQQITGLIAGTVYYVRVRALSNLGTSDNSSILTQITVPTAPNQPIISNITSNTFTATWGNVIGASSYRIDVATTSNFTSGFITEYNNKEVTSTTINIENLSPGITYYVRIRAVNDQTANIVTSENSVSAVQITTPAPPSTLTATNITTTSFNVDWNTVVGATSYRIDVSDPTIVNVNFPFLNNFLPGYENLTVNGTTQSITGLTPGKIYYVRVRSVNSNLISENSSSLIRITIPTAPNQPTISQLSSTSFRVAWNSVIGASSYRLDVATSSNFTTGFVTNYNDATVGTTSSLVVGLIPGTVYYVRVRAVNDQTANTVTSENSIIANQATILESPVLTASTLITTTSFTANWNSVTNATSYRLDVSTDLFTTFIPGYSNLTVNNTTQSITGLTPGTTYYVRIRAVNSATTSSNSTTFSQITNSLPATPNAPTPTNITTTNFTANWNSVTNATSYRLDVSTVSNFATRLTGYDNLVVNGTSQIVTGLSHGTIYYIRIRSVSPNGTSLDSSTLITTTKLATPNTPTATNITTTSFTANWGIGVNVTSYRLDVSEFSSSSFEFGILPNYNNLTVNGTTQSITGLTPGKIYYVRVRAVNSNVISENSPLLVQVTIPVAPNQPTISQLSSTSFRVAWNSVIGASSYRLDVATSSNFTTGFVTNYNDATVGTTSSLVVGLIPGTVYYVRVRAVNDQAANIVTSVDSISTTQLTPLSAPIGLAATNINFGSFTINWTSVLGATSYRLDVSNVSNFATRFPGYDNLVVNGTSQAVTGLIIGEVYYVRVRAVNAAGVSGDNSKIFSIDLSLQGFSQVAWPMADELLTNDDASVFICGSPNYSYNIFFPPSNLGYSLNRAGGIVAFSFNGNSYSSKYFAYEQNDPITSAVNAPAYNNSYFGANFAIDSNGSTIFVSTPYDDTYTSESYIFRKTGTINNIPQWSRTRILEGTLQRGAAITSNGLTGVLTSRLIEYNGTSWSNSSKFLNGGDSAQVINKNNTVLIAANDINNSITIYNLQNWGVLQTISFPNERLIRTRGVGKYKIVVSDDASVIAIILGPGTTSLNRGPYYVRIYTGNINTNWSEVQTIQAPATDTVPGSIKFLNSLSINGAGNILVIGEKAAFSSRIGYEGLVHIYVRNNNGTWFKNKTLTDPDGTRPNYFGDSVAIDRSGSTILIGSNSEPTSKILIYKNTFSQI